MNDEKDKYDHLTIMRVRTGPSQGDSTERQMLDAIDDTGNFRTRLLGHPDGTTTRMKTKGGMPEFITDEAASLETPCTLSMDSGAVDLRSVTFMHTNPLDDASGILWRTPYVQGVISAGTISGIGPVVGKLNPPSTKGTPPSDGTEAQSFLNSEKLGSPYSKKQLAALVPPSVFTGKMRQYIQALYGRHDHAEMFQLSSTVGTGLPFALNMDWEKKFDTYLTLDTNCGIYTDPASWEHYLLFVGTSSVAIYKLVPDSCAAKLVPHLKSTSVSASNKDRIEAYILSRSKPSLTSKVEITLPSTISNKSMGYGWHFNWDGTCCDIVHNAEVAAPGGGSENESVHLRLTFSLVGSEWSIAPSTVEGPVRWKSLRYVDAITSPNWVFMVLERFGAHLGPSPYGDAPFYVFYTRNELKVCRYSSATTTEPNQEITREPYYYNPGTSTSIGSDAVNYRTRNTWTTRATTLSCGSVSCSFNTDTYTDNVFTRTSPDPGNIHTKSSFGPTPGYGNGTVNAPVGQPSYIPMFLVYDYYGGYISVYSGGGESGWATEPIVYNNERSDFGPLFVRADTEIFSAAVQNTAQFISVVPFCDSESIYIYGEKTTSSHEVGTSQTDHAAWYTYEGGWEAQDIRAFHGVGGTPSGVAYYEAENIADIDRVVSSVTSAEFIVCNKGVYSEVDFPAKSSFWAFADTIAQQYPTYSSASGNSVIAPSNAVSSGNPTEVDINNPLVYVGWA